jgi:hypothetical protein
MQSIRLYKHLTREKAQALAFRIIVLADTAHLPSVPSLNAPNNALGENNTLSAHSNIFPRTTLRGSAPALLRKCVKDSRWESSLLVRQYEQTEAADLPHHELA